MIIQANGSSFHCRTDGDRGPWVMLSHGLATDMSMWDELAEALSDRYRVLRYDARGHGESAAPAGDYTLDMLVADAAGILDALGVEQTHFAGLSMGGMIAIGMLINHPCEERGHRRFPAYHHAGIYQSVASARRCGSQARDRGNRGVDGVPLVERRIGRAKSSRDCTNEFHGPQNICQRLLRLRRRISAVRLRLQAE